MNQSKCKAHVAEAQRAELGIIIQYLISNKREWKKAPQKTEN